MPIAVLKPCLRMEFSFPKSFNSEVCGAIEQLIMNEHPILEASLTNRPGSTLDLPAPHQCCFKSFMNHCICWYSLVWEGVPLSKAQHIFSFSPLKDMKTDTHMACMWVVYVCGSDLGSLCKTSLLVWWVTHKITPCIYTCTYNVYVCKWNKYNRIIAGHPMSCISLLKGCRGGQGKSSEGRHIHRHAPVRSSFHGTYIKTSILNQNFAFFLYCFANNISINV